jgi:cation:H+ antiporter
MFSSGKAVKYVMKLSRIFGISEMSAGFIILSVATSLPELVVSINAAMIGEGALAVGNVLGSNIANITIILGLAVIISRKRKIVFTKKVFDNLIEFLFISSLIPLFILQTGHVSLVLGIVLISLFIFFSFKTPTKVKGIEGIHVVFKKDKILVIIKFVIAVIIVIISSNFVVDSSVNIAALFSIPPSIIGATVIALGTSLPELTTTVQAFRKRLYNVGLGNVIGSCITNLTLILGITSIFNNVQLNIVSFTSLTLFAIMASMITWYFVSTGRRLDKREAFLLIGLYTIFILQELGFSLFVL